jgi:antitoxin component of RelBE/YafQ-DinJ toxin-antitoxin module
MLARVIEIGCLPVDFLQVLDAVRGQSENTDDRRGVRSSKGLLPNPQPQGVHYFLGKCISESCLPFHKG